MTFRHILAAAVLAGLGAPAFACQVVTPTLDERGYTQRWDPTVQGKTRAQAQSELDEYRAKSPMAVRLGVYPSPRPAQAADRAQVQRDAYQAARTPASLQYVR